MKFTRKRPDRSGWYYVLTTDYPIPRPAFYYRGILYLGKYDVDLLYKNAWEHWRIGDEIPIPACADITIER